MPEHKPNVDQLSKKRTYLAFFAILQEWILIAVAFGLYYYLQQAWLLVILIPFIATRMYALYSLLHDGIHYLLFQSKPFNDWMSRLFLAEPLFIDLQVMRHVHFMHHAHLKKKDDPEMKQLGYPEFQFPLSKSRLMLIFFMDISGLNFIKYKLFRLKSGFSLKSLNWRLLFWTAMVLVFWKLAILKYFLLLWVIPYCTVYQALNRFRLYYEHNNLDDDNYLTRSVAFNPIISFFVSPHNLGYHTEHHLYPKVPFYNLPKLHKQLADGRVYLETSLVGLMQKIWS